LSIFRQDNLKQSVQLAMWLRSKLKILRDKKNNSELHVRNKREQMKLGELLLP